MKLNSIRFIFVRCLSVNLLKLSDIRGQKDVSRSWIFQFLQIFLSRSHKSNPCSVIITLSLKMKIDSLQSEENVGVQEPSVIMN